MKGIERDFGPLALFKFEHETSARNGQMTILLASTSSKR